MIKVQYKNYDRWELLRRINQFSYIIKNIYIISYNYIFTNNFIIFEGNFASKDKFYF
jgi:hypothetical protein